MRPKSSIGASAPTAPRRIATAIDIYQPSSASNRPRRTDVSESDVSESGSDSENPAIDAPTPKASRPRTNQDWWPNQLDLSVLNQHSPHADPMGDGFDYAAEFATLDVEALR